MNEQKSNPHGNREDCVYTVPEVCSVLWTVEDWDNRCQNPNHKEQRIKEHDTIRS